MGKRQKYGYFHGRFQPFHAGHFGMVKEMLKNHDTIVIGISNPFRVLAKPEDSALGAALAAEDTRNPINNPWPYWQRVLMITRSLEIEGFNPSRVIIMPNLIASGFDPRETELPREEVVVYTMPTGKHNKLLMERDQKIGEVVVFDPNQRGISGTEMRKMLKASDAKWEDYVPAGTVEIIKKYGMGTYYEK